MEAGEQQRLKNTIAQYICRDEYWTLEKRGYWLTNQEYPLCTKGIFQTTRG